MYTHVEAFCIMLYACNSCIHREMIWNSRDGVTPFSCQCPSCGGTMSHTDFKKDRFAPDHQLHHRQKFWRDATPDDLIKNFEAQIKVMNITDQSYISQRMTEITMQTGQYAPGTPWLDIHDRCKV
jgi:hypothetical protein